MSIDCEIIPRPELRAPQLRSLGKALVGWAREAWIEGYYNWVDEYALDDLAGGRFPRPLLKRLLKRLQEMGDSTEPLDEAAIARSLGSEAEGRTILLCAKSDASPAAVVDSLKRHIPASLVKDVLIDGLSWNCPVASPAEHR